MKILLHWDNKHYDELADPLPPGVALQSVMAGGLVEVYRTRREPVPKPPLPQRICAAVVVASMLIGGILLITWLLPVFLFGCLFLTSVVAPIKIGRELWRQRRAVKGTSKNKHFAQHPWSSISRVEAKAPTTLD